MAKTHRGGVPVIKLDGLKIERRIINLVPRELAEHHILIPIRFAIGRNDTLVVAMADPQNQTAIDDLMIMTGYKVEQYVADECVILKAINLHYPPKVEDEPTKTATPAEPVPPEAPLDPAVFQSLLALRGEIQSEVRHLKDRLSVLERRMTALDDVIKKSGGADALQRLEDQRFDYPRHPFWPRR